MATVKQIRQMLFEIEDQDAELTGAQIETLVAEAAYREELNLHADIDEKVEEQIKKEALRIVMTADPECVPGSDEEAWDTAIGNILDVGEKAQPTTPEFADMIAKSLEEEVVRLSEGTPGGKE